MKSFPFFLVILILAVPLYANPIIEYGLLISGNSTTFDGNYQNTPNIDEVSNKSFGMGGMLLLNISDKVGLQFEPLFIEKGGNNGRPADQYRAIHINYFEFPVFAKFNYKRVYLLGGGFQAIRLSAKRYYNLKDDLSIKHHLKKNDSGVIVGAGVNLPLQNTNRFVFELQYSKSLTNIIAYENNGNDELKINMLSFRIGLIF